MGSSSLAADLDLLRGPFDIQRERVAARSAMYFCMVAFGRSAATIEAVQAYVQSCGIVLVAVCK